MSNINTAPRQLAIANENNKLQQDEFIQIHFAPPRACFNKAGVYRGTFIEEDFNQVFVITDKDEQIFVKLKDFTRIKFCEITNYYSQLCSGCNAYTWKVDFMTRYPKTTNETEMAIYEYERVEK